MAEPDRLEHGNEPLAFEAGPGIGIGEGVAQATERNIGLLRQEEGAALIEADLAAAERPDPGNRAQQRALAGTGRSGDEE